eukprot:GHVU01229669.1.p1 GENE.GHVU01229669.1~~GHVU01229669.1.p1  ORF type:complete len:277 (+),score=68.82 GHVU01229669.1:1-831(+)
MYFAGVQLNILTMILLILSIGFSVDYTVHMAHTFAHCLGASHDLRVIETLVLMGNPVTHGAVSTWLGILVMLPRPEYVLQLFFKMLTLVLAFGLFHGILILPVLLSFFGPRTMHDEENEEEEGEGGGRKAVEELTEETKPHLTSASPEGGRKEEGEEEEEAEECVVVGSPLTGSSGGGRRRVNRRGRGGGDFEELGNDKRRQQQAAVGSGRVVQQAATDGDPSGGRSGHDYGHDYGYYHNHYHYGGVTGGAAPRRDSDTDGLPPLTTTAAAAAFNE